MLVRSKAAGIIQSTAEEGSILRKGDVIYTLEIMKSLYDVKVEDTPLEVLKVIALPGDLVEKNFPLLEVDLL